jgi:hypothetical protein
VLSELKTPVVGLVVSVLLFVGLGLYGLVDLLGTLAGGTTLGGLLAAALPYLLGLVLVGLVGLGFAAWGLYRLVTAVDLDALDSERLRSLTDRVQQRYL